ncbi:transcription termination/antitermination NusG family protein [Pedobacter sp. UYP1]|uniref:transcription termination/antitermination NusG family protein n=1 Tax=Pedobacter sp. UYP1 TaxID=1756396 RepID=UPI00339114E1
MNNNYNGWYVLYIKLRYERKVHDLLNEASLESFLPLIESERQWSDRKKSILKPLFPSHYSIAS